MLRDHNCVLDDVKAGMMSNPAMVRRGSVWCGVAQYGAAWLSMVRRGSVWCSVAQLMVRRGSVGSTSACCKAGPSSILGSAPQVGFTH